MPKRPVSDPTPLMHIRLPPVSPPHSPATDTQKSLPSFTKPYNVASSKIPDITSVFFRSNEGPVAPDVTDTTNPKLSAKEHYESSMAPLTSPESKSISSTNVLNEACPNPSSMFHCLFMNIIAHLISKTKQKLKFLADLCDANTLFLFL